MNRIRLPLVMFLMAALCSSSALAAGPVKIGLITTLSGPAGYTGQDVRDGFALAVAQENGKLGGVPVDVLVEDDALKPATGRSIADRFLQQDKAKILTGVVFSNVMAAVVPDALAAGAMFVSPNAGSSEYAGKGCNKDIFVASFQNDAANVPAGVYANQHGWKKMVLMAADYVAGRDMIAGFKVSYKGTAQEIYPKLDQTDFSAEIARIRDAKPDALFYFLPGGAGINFLKQYAQSGLKIPLIVTVFSLDEQILAAVGKSALGMSVIGHYNIDFPNAENKQFVTAFEARYHRVPTFYAADAYDTAHLIGSGLRAANGDDSKLDVIRAEMRKADFKSVRGSFKFGPNQYPIQDWYLMHVQTGANGKPAIVTQSRVVKDYGDPFAAQCKM
ncbi:MAG TPA: ABC transporter substrate-binding protein [Candidatus Lustribacter sp.]